MFMENKMKKDIQKFIKINKNEVLRYLEYKGQNIDSDLYSKIENCINETKEKINPRYTMGVYSISKTNEEGKKIINLDNTNLNFVSKDLFSLLENCEECIIFAATLGLEIDRQIKYNSYLDLTKSIIMDACATTAIEEYCDLIQESIEKSIIEQEKYITNRYSPGYGDLSIEINEDISNLLDARKKIGLTISTSKIMIPRKSVIAIIGVSDIKTIDKIKSCSNCSNINNCKYKRGDEICGNKRVYKK